MAHGGVEVLIQNMMIHSLSPQARRLVEQMYTGDPFHIDIKLDSDSKNRSAEIANTYMKAIGRRLDFIKKKKVYKSPVLFSPVKFNRDPDTHITTPITFVPKSVVYNKDYDPMKALEERGKEISRANATSPVKFLGVRRDENGVRLSYKEFRDEE